MTAKHRKELAIIHNQTRLALCKEQYNHEWEMQALKDQSPFLRLFSFFMLTFMIAIPVISPDDSKLIYERLKEAPEWLVTIYFSVLSAVWGLAELKNSIPQLVNSWKKAKQNDPAPTTKKQASK